MGTSLHASAPGAAAAARQARDDDVEEGDDGVDDGFAGGRDGVHDRHDAVADGAEDTLNAGYDGTHDGGCCGCCVVVGLWLVVMDGRLAVEWCGADEVSFSDV